MNHDKMKFEHAWRHFQVHAGQRMQNFQYALAFVAATYAVMASAQELHADTFLRVAGGLGIVVSMLFWLIDVRTRTLVRHAESALKDLEKTISQGDTSSPAAIFHASDRVKFGTVTYSSAFFLVFALNIGAIAALAFPAELSWTARTLATWVEGLLPN